MAEERYRVPDVLVLVQPFRITPILLEPPAIVIEVLSSEDRLSMMLIKLADFERFGVGSLFVIDPEQQVLFRAKGGGIEHVTDRTVRLATPSGEVAVDLEPLFADIISL